MMQILFGYVRNFVLSRAGSTLIGVFALMALVWFAGPMVGLKDTTVRLIIIAGIAAVALLYVGISWLLARRRGARLQKDMEAQAGSDARQADIAALQKKMSEAIASLKTSELGLKHRGTAALYALPWFMIIGPSAAGKSTLLRNSGLHFPYAHADDVDIKGFGGTRNCDWWFSDQAVILDTAGRYTTEDSDREEWIAFLQMLKKHRRRMPINGIIVAISIADILTADEDALEWHVKVIRDRVDELINHLGFLFPLYLVFTKCDLLNGFQAYFGELSEKERHQVWGSYIEGLRPGDDPAEKIGALFDELYAKLCDLRIRKLALQRNHAVKAEIFDFPAQFQAAADRLMEFINLLFKDNPYQEWPNFKGIYFTSGTQEGKPLQRIVGNLRQAFGYVEQKEEPPRTEKSYFITELLQDVIFRAPRDLLMGRRKRLITRTLKTATMLGAVALIMVSAGLLSTAFTQNTLRLKAGTDAAAELRAATERGSRVEQATALAALYRHYVSLRSEDQRDTWAFRLGLYRAREQAAPLEGLLVAALHRQFLVPVARVLETQLQNYARRWEAAADQGERTRLRGDYYNTLKAYLMLSDPRHLQAGEILPLLYTTWRATLATGAGSEEQALLEKLPEADAKGLIRLYLDRMTLPPEHRFAAAAWKANPDYVETARLQLRTPPNPELLYAQIREKGRVLLKDTRLSRLLKSRGASRLESDYVLPVVFTRRGWESFVSREVAIVSSGASRGDWVLGTLQEASAPMDEELRAELEREIRQLYFDEYARTWIAFLASIRLQDFTSISDAAGTLRLLARPEGPLAELMKVVADNVSLYEIKWKLDKVGKPDEKGRRTRTPVPEVDVAFNDLRRFAVPSPKKPVSELVNQYLMALAGVQAELDRLRGSTERDREAEMVAASILSGRGGNTELYKAWVTTTGILNGTGMRTRQAIEPLLMKPVRESWRVILASGMREVQQKWVNMVVREYDERIRGRFPFSSRGPDVAIDDVAEFFRPRDGILWSFVENHLGPYLVRNRSRWRERRWLDVGPQFERSFLSALNRSARITRGLFRRGSDQPSVTFYLYPMPTPGLSEILLETNGQMYRYRNEPQEWRRFTWPGEANRSGARVIGVSEKQNLRAEMTEHGLWGLFHLFRKARVVRERGAQYLSEWTMKAANGRPVKVRFKVKADRYNNVFQPGLMRGLVMPERMAAITAGTRLARKE